MRKNPSRAVSLEGVSKVFLTTQVENEDLLPTWILDGSISGEAPAELVMSSRMNLPGEEVHTTQNVFLGYPTFLGFSRQGFTVAQVDLLTRQSSLGAEVKLSHPIIFMMFEREDAFRRHDVRLTACQEQSLIHCVSNHPLKTRILCDQRSKLGSIGVECRIQTEKVSRHPCYLRVNKFGHIYFAKIVL